MRRGDRNREGHITTALNRFQRNGTRMQRIKVWHQINKAKNGMQCYGLNFAYAGRRIYKSKCTHECYSLIHHSFYLLINLQGAMWSNRIRIQQYLHFHIFKYINLLLSSCWSKPYPLGNNSCVQIERSPQGPNNTG